MLTQEPTEEMLRTWQAVFEAYRPRLKPNRKTGGQLVDYLLAHYPMEPFSQAEADEVIAGNVLENAFWREKLPQGAKPEPKTFWLMKNGKRLFVGVDLTTGMYHVEPADGDDMGETQALWDELLAFQGLDELDLQNCYLVYEYVTCLKKAEK